MIKRFSDWMKSDWDKGSGIVGFLFAASAIAFGTLAGVQAGELRTLSEAAARCGDTLAPAVVDAVESIKSEDTTNAKTTDPTTDSSAEKESGENWIRPFQRDDLGSNSS